MNLCAHIALCLGLGFGETLWFRVQTTETTCRTMFVLQPMAQLWRQTIDGHNSRVRKGAFDGDCLGDPFYHTLSSSISVKRALVLQTSRLEYHILSTSRQTKEPSMNILSSPALSLLCLESLLCQMYQCARGSCRC